MSTEWKPGDVAMVAAANGTKVIYIRTKTGAWNGVDEFGEEYTQRLVDGSARPLVVIDPEDREQVARMVKCTYAATEFRDDWENMQAALREFANPTPPRTDEPQGLGAVVEDSVGRVWVFADTTRSGLRWHGEDGWRTWDELNPVRILSEGVTP